MAKSNHDVNALMIKNLNEALTRSRAELEKIESEYHRLRAQVLTYERSLLQFQDLESGKFREIVEEDSAPIILPQRDIKQLKDHIYDYFSSRPSFAQSPKGLSMHLLTDREWPEKGLRIRVSNLLRKIAKEEPWLERKGHGKYQFISN